MSSNSTRLDIPRHLQDYNGYCGPACALMLIDFAGSAHNPPIFAQPSLFSDLRHHAEDHDDFRPFYSPAESLLATVNSHTASGWEWTKIYNPDPRPVAKRLIAAILEREQPSLILINEGAHWVVAFGVSKNESGEPTGLFVRDPAWTGMPDFLGFTTFPEEPRINHKKENCPCMAPKGKNNPGTVHERYFPLAELLTHRGLQGAPDHEGEGAIALVPPGETTVPVVISPPSTATPVLNPGAHAGSAALSAVKKYGLTGSPHSPDEWNKALTGATAGEPTLVKHPTDERDDFYLVPLNPADPKARLGAWAMLDAKTLELREVSLLRDWKTPAFPDPDKDVKQLSDSQVTLSDGTVKKYKPQEITPNPANLVWTPSSAAVLPYWPVKEFTVPHPKTGAPEKIYLNQDGEIHTTLTSPNHTETPSPSKPPKKPLPKKGGLGPAAKGFIAAVVIGGGMIGYKKLTNKPVREGRAARSRVIILETFEKEPPGVTDTNQPWVSISDSPKIERVFFQERDGVAIMDGKNHGVEQGGFIRGITFLPNSSYKLSMEISKPPAPEDFAGFGLFLEPHAKESGGSRWGIYRMGESIVFPRRRKTQTYPAKNEIYTLAIILRTNDDLKNSTLSWHAGDKQLGAPITVDANRVSGISINSTSAQGTIDNVTLTQSNIE